MKSLLHQSFVFAHQVTISQAGIAAQTLPVTLSLMLRSKEKEIKITQHDCAQSRDEPSVLSTKLKRNSNVEFNQQVPYHYTTGATSTQFRVDASKCCI